MDVDLAILHFFNGGGNMLMDQVVWVLSSGVTWIPLYLALFYIVVRNNETMPQIGLILPMALSMSSSNRLSGDGGLATTRSSNTPFM